MERAWSTGRRFACLTFCLGLCCAAANTSVSFDTDAPGSLPAGWSAAMTHSGGAPKWQVIRDSTAPSQPNVLAQLSTDSTAGRFPLAICDKSSFQNGDLGVKFKTISGKIDQAAGLVWRYKD